MEFLVFFFNFFLIVFQFVRGCTLECPKSTTCDETTSTTNFLVPFFIPNPGKYDSMTLVAWAGVVEKYDS